MPPRTNVFIAVIIAFLICFVLIWLLPSTERTFINILSVIGFVLSILGLMFAFVQIQSVKDIALETKRQIDESIALNSKILMISDLSRKAVMVDEMQNYLKAGKIEPCILRMKDMKVILNSLRNQQQYSDLFKKRNFNEVFQSFNSDMDNLQIHHLDGKNKLDRSLIIKNMEELSTLLQSVEVKLKNSDNDQR